MVPSRCKEWPTLWNLNRGLSLGMQTGMPCCTWFDYCFLISALECDSRVWGSKPKIPVILTQNELCWSQQGCIPVRLLTPLGFMPPWYPTVASLCASPHALSGFNHCFQILTCCCTDLQSLASTGQCQHRASPGEQRTELSFPASGSAALNLVHSDMEMYKI